MANVETTVDRYEVDAQQAIAQLVALARAQNQSTETFNRHKEESEGAGKGLSSFAERVVGLKKEQTQASRIGGFYARQILEMVPVSGQAGMALRSLAQMFVTGATAGVGFGLAMEAAVFIAHGVTEALEREHKLANEIMLDSRKWAREVGQAFNDLSTKMQGPMSETETLIREKTKQVMASLAKLDDEAASEQHKSVWSTFWELVLPGEDFFTRQEARTKKAAQLQQQLADLPVDPQATQAKRDEQKEADRKWDIESRAALASHYLGRRKIMAEAAAAEAKLVHDTPEDLRGSEAFERRKASIWADARAKARDLDLANEERWRAAEEQARKETLDAESKAWDARNDLASLAYLRSEVQGDTEHAKELVKLQQHYRTVIREQAGNDAEQIRLMNEFEGRKLVLIAEWRSKEETARLDARLAREQEEGVAEGLRLYNAGKVQGYLAQSGDLHRAEELAKLDEWMHEEELKYAGHADVLLAIEQEYAAKRAALLKSEWERGLDRLAGDAYRQVADRIGQAFADIANEAGAYDAAMRRVNEASLADAQARETEARKAVATAERQMAAQGKNARTSKALADAQRELAAAQHDVRTSQIALSNDAGASLAKWTQALLGNLAQQAAVEAVMETARGFAALAAGTWPPNPAAWAAATQHFIAAGVFAGVAGLAAAGGYAIGKSRGMTKEEAGAVEAAGSYGVGGGAGGGGGGTGERPAGAAAGGETVATREVVYVFVGDPFETPQETARRAARRMELAQRLNMWKPKEA